jgi:hypothetical protein
MFSRIRAAFGRLLQLFTLALLSSFSLSSGLTGIEAAPLCGIYTLDSQGGVYRDKNIRAYPFVEGYALRASWAEMELSQDVFDFAILDHIVGRLEPLGLKLSLALARGEPVWLAETPGVVTWFDAHPRINRERPVPWEPFLLERLPIFVKALSDHQVWSSTLGRSVPLRNHPVLAGINFGIMGADGAIRDPDPGDGPLIVYMPGYTRSKFKNAILRNLHAATDYFPKQATFVGFWKVQDSNRNPYLWEDIRMMILQEFNGVKNPKVGFFQENFSASRKAPGEAINGSPSKDFAAPLYKSKDQTFTASQALQSWINPFRDPKKTAYTVPSDAIQYGYDTFNALYFELYVPDLDKAAADPTWDEALSEWGDALCSQ